MGLYWEEFKRLLLVCVHECIGILLWLNNDDKKGFIIEQSSAMPWLSLQSLLLLSDRIDEAVKKIFVKQRDH